MLETGLEVIVHNLNRKNNDLRFYEFGKTYSTSGSGKYNESEHLCLYFTGAISESSWRGKSQASDLLYVKGVIERLAQLTGLGVLQFERSERPKLNPSLDILNRKKFIGSFGTVNSEALAKFDIKQPVYYVDLDWQEILIYIKAASSSVQELPKQLPVHRPRPSIASARCTAKAGSRNIKCS